MLFIYSAMNVTAQSSVLASGKWYKVAVDHHGVYKIDLAKFRAMGFDKNTDPRKVKIYGNQGGMLPQANNAARPEDLEQLSIFVKGEQDGVFHSGDYILFYAEGPDHFHLDQGSGTFFYEKNLYDDQNYYYITVGSTNGKRIDTEASLGSNFPVVDEFDNFEYHELDQHSQLFSGREWYGERFDPSNTRDLKINASNIIASSSIRVISDVVAIKSYLGSSFTIKINNVSLGTQYVLPVANSTYGDQGRHQLDTFNIAASMVNTTGATQTISYKYAENGEDESIGYLDRFLFQFRQNLRLYNNQTAFRSLQSLDNAVSRFSIANSTNQSTIWNVSDSNNPVIQEATLSGDKLEFSTTTTELKEFIVFNNNVTSPELVGVVENQDLHALATPDLLIVTPETFRLEAEKLAMHRAAVSNYEVAVVNVADIYNEFSSGRKDVTAIRDFTRYLYEKNPSKLKSLLLFGKGSYDYKNISRGGNGFVPIYESRNSLHNLRTFASDDYYGFLEPSEGEWGEDPVVNHTMDIGVGRLPVKTAAEARSIVDKIIDYETNPRKHAEWLKEITFVADDGNNDDGYSKTHQDQADQMADNIETSNALFDTEKIFVGAYEKKVKYVIERCPGAEADIKKAFNSGSLIINYTGHGKEDLWGNETIFNDTAINNLTNEKYPFLVTATCDFGRHDDPTVVSGGELVVLKEKGGAVGMVTTTRLVNASTNFQLNQAFYNAFFERQSNGYQTIGEIFRHTKNNSLSGVANRNFSLLADPSMTLNLPKRDILITEIKSNDGTNVLKALSTVTVKGEVRHFDGTIDDNFNGILTVKLFDKETTFTTIGKNNPPFTFSEWDNVLYRGQSTVNNGQFEFQFILTKNIEYQINEGKLSLYAYDETQNADAAGYTKSFDVGSSEDNASDDSISPMIKAFIGDTTFINGGLTDPNTYLVATFEDASGINISNYGIGNSIIAILDNGEPITLNEYYYTAVDDYTRGQLRYPLNDLSPGHHTLKIKAWDTYNNPGEATVDFIVTDGERVRITEFASYPNPFNTSTKLYFTHNRSGDDLIATVYLYDRTGETIMWKEIVISESQFYVDLLEFDRSIGGLKNLSTGLYFARLILRSLSNGSKNERVTKLILTN